jgi:hypothetical protein
MALDTQQPGAGFASQALEVSERARARGLLDLLEQTQSNIRQGVDSELLEQEAALRTRLNRKLADRVKLMSGEHTAEESEAAEAEVRILSDEHEKILEQIRVASPHYADLVRPHPLKLEEIQRDLLDPETILLEYGLFRDHSFLWAVTRDTITSYYLPPQRQIETAVRKSLAKS